VSLTLYYFHINCLLILILIAFSNLGFSTFFWNLSNFTQTLNMYFRNMTPTGISEFFIFIKQRHYLLPSITRCVAHTNSWVPHLVLESFLDIKRIELLLIPSYIPCTSENSQRSFIRCCNSSSCIIGRNTEKHFPVNWYIM
jgi:hypothetical protein